MDGKEVRSQPACVNSVSLDVSTKSCNSCKLNFTWLWQFSLTILWRSACFSSEGIWIVFGDLWYGSEEQRGPVDLCSRVHPTSWRRICRASGPPFTGRKSVSLNTLVSKPHWPGHSFWRLGGLSFSGRASRSSGWPFCIMAAGSEAKALSTSL